jgi:phosphoglycerate dehydrogenase-like enzyme
LQLKDEHLDTLRRVSSRLDLRRTACRNPEEVTAALDEGVEILFTFHGPSRMEGAPRLRWVQLFSAGADHLMDTPVWGGSTVITTTSGIHACTVGEYVLASMLAFSHRFPRLFEHQKRSEWPEDRFAKLVGHELRGHTVCIVGYGSLGREVARLCGCLGMRVLAVKRDPENRRDAGFIFPDCGDPEGTIPAAFYSPEGLRVALAESDYVVIAVPATPFTRQLMGEGELRAMRRHAYLVNVARGSVVDQEALVRALREGWIGGAGLDVFDPEPLPADSPLWQLDNAIISPHISGFTHRIADYATDLFAENLRRYLAGEPLLNQVDRERYY